jgi:hypothetical protein
MLGPNSLFASHIASEIFSLYPMSLSPKRVWLRYAIALPGTQGTH